MENWTIMQGLETILHDKIWLAEIFIIVLMTAIAHTAELVIYGVLQRKFAKTHSIWDESLLKAFHRPFGFLIWLLGICFAAEIAGSATQKSVVFSIVGPIRDLGVLTLITWFVLRFIRMVEENLLKPRPDKEPPDQTTLHAIAQILSVSVIVTSVLAALRLFNISISAVLAFGGIGGAAVAFAAKDVLGNFFGGLMVYLDRPFQVGDWIRSPDKQIEGTVEHIGWRLTRIRTFDRRPLYVPNGLFSTISVENPSRMQNRRIYTNIGLRYQDASKVAGIITEIKSMLREHPEIDTNRILIVNLNEFAASSLNFMVYTFTKTTDWVRFQEIQQDVFLKIIDIITNHGAECAFPTQTIHLPDSFKAESIKLAS